MVKRSAVLFLLLTLFTAFTLPPPVAAQSGGGLSAPVTGKADRGGKVSGTLTIRRFVNVGTATEPAVGAVGTLSLDTPNGPVITQVTVPVTLRGGAAAAGAGGITTQQLACEILDLTLGPLDLNLLGLEIHLDTVHLVIEANPLGGLLGQLLCGIANLLNLGDILGVINALNELIAFLEGLLG